MTAAPSWPTRRLADGLKVGAALLCLLLPMEAKADSLGAELRSLRQDLQTAEAPLQLAQAGSYQGDRIAAFESVIRDLTGRLESAEHRLRQLEERVQRLERTTDAPAAPASDRPSAYYEPPAETSSGQGAPRVLGTPTETFGTGGGGASGAASMTPRSQETGTAGGAPLPEDSADTAGASAQTAALPDGDAATQYDHAFGLLRQARWDEAQAALEAFLEQHPDDRLSGNAKYWLGETHYVRGDYVSAARVFAEGFQSYPDSSKAPDNLLKLGMSLGMLDRQDDACGTLVELERRYSDAPAQILQRSRTERERLGC